MTIDTEIRHVTKPCANLFLELGFSSAEAKKLHAASRTQINDTRLLKQQLMVELSNWIAEHQLRPRVRHQTNNFGELGSRSPMESTSCADV
jgi:hypothetical protein